MKERGLSVRDAELRLRALAAEAGAEPKGRRRRVSGGGLDPEARRLPSELEELFGTRVSVTRRGSQGKIVVEFYSDEELRGILDRLNRSGESEV
jgi:ParB family chromosome partitioning protein